MELRLLRYFLTVAREENITRAAESLFITQPTLSRQLMELEQELGTQLFVRGKRNVTLTEDGTLLRRRAEEMLELEAKISAEFKNQKDDLSGVISIGAAETKGFGIIPKVIDSFRQKYPLVTFDVYSGIATHIKDRLERGLTDIALLVEPGDIDKYDFLRLNISDRCGILMNTAAPLAQKEFVTVDDLIGLPVIANKRTEVQQFYRNALGIKYDELNVIATFNLINNAACFAQNNSGYVFTIEGTVKNYENSSVCFRPFYPEISQSAYLVWKKFQPTSRAVKKFLQEFTMLYKHCEP